MKEIILNKENLGIATALNIGVRKALENGYEWILTMDQDPEVDYNGIRKINVLDWLLGEEK